MRDLSKAKLIDGFSTRSGDFLIKVLRGKRGAIYTCFMVQIPGTRFLTPRDLRDMRQTQLTEAARYVGDLLSENRVKQEVAEKILDLIYSELNRRLFKKDKVT